MASLRVVIQDYEHSKKTTVELPDGVPMHRLLPELAARIQLPVQLEGHPIIYRLDHHRSSRILNDEDTLQSAGVTPGDLLRIVPIVTAVEQSSLAAKQQLDIDLLTHVTKNLGPYPVEGGRLSSASMALMSKELKEVIAQSGAFKAQFENADTGQVPPRHSAFGGTASARSGVGASDRGRGTGRPGPEPSDGYADPGRELRLRVEWTAPFFTRGPGTTADDLTRILLCLQSFFGEVTEATGIPEHDLEVKQMVHPNTLITVDGLPGAIEVARDFLEICPNLVVSIWRPPNRVNYGGWDVEVDGSLLDVLREALVVYQKANPPAHKKQSAEKLVKKRLKYLKLKSVPLYSILLAE